MPGMNGEVTIRAADLSQVIQLPIDAIRPTNELAPVARMFGLSVDSITNQMRKDLLGTEGTTGVPGRYVVVALADGSLRDAAGQDRPDGPAGSAGHGRREGRRQGRDIGRDHHGEAGGPADAPARGQYPPPADATGIAADPGWSDRNTSRPTRGSEPAEAGGSEAERGTDAGRASGINQETVKANTGSLFAFSYLLATGTACVHPTPSIEGSAASPASAAALWSPSSSVVSAAARDARHSGPPRRRRSERRSAAKAHGSRRRRHRASQQPRDAQHVAPGARQRRSLRLEREPPLSEHHGRRDGEQLARARHDGPPVDDAIAGRPDAHAGVHGARLRRPLRDDRRRASNRRRRQPRAQLDGREHDSAGRGGGVQLPLGAGAARRREIVGRSRHGRARRGERAAPRRPGDDRRRVAGADGPVASRARPRDARGLGAGRARRARRRHGSPREHGIRDPRRAGDGFSFLCGAVGRFADRIGDSEPSGAGAGARRGGRGVVADQGGAIGVFARAVLFRDRRQQRVKRFRLRG